MKHLKFKYMIWLFPILMLGGCDFMDCDESSDYTKDEILASYARTKQLVTNIYGYLPHDFCNTEGAMLDAATDDALHIYESSAIQRFVNGTWSPNYTVDDVWGRYYQGVHDANFYLKETEGQTFESWKYGDNYENWMKDFENYKYEVRFLRAFFYFELAKRYCNVPLVLEVLTEKEANEVVPSSCEKVMDFVIAECADLAKVLPINYAGFADNETGRITKGMALALKSRAALYLASPLYSANSQEKWKDAAKAAYELIKISGELGYRLDDRYENLFGPANNLSPEVIMARPAGESTSFEAANFPIGVEGGKTSTCPTENLVSCYEMVDGTAFDWNNPTHKSNPYNNRDPRLGFTVVYNGMVWPAKKQVQIWEGGDNGLPLSNATTTGYYLKKYVNSDISFAAGVTVSPKHHNWVLFRYAEILLNYAEAMVNAFHGPDYSDADFPLSALEAVNQVRARANVSMPAYPDDITEVEFLKRLKNERRVELAFEGHRFWDIRRWKELDASKDIYRVNVQKQGGQVKYAKELLTTRAVSDKVYFYPISNQEIYKNGNLIQNENW